MARTARNVVIILALAAGFAFLPNGGTTAALISGILYQLFLVVTVVFAVKFYVEHRVEIFSLGDRDRALLYAAIGVLVVALAGRRMWVQTGAGTAAFVALLAFAGYAGFSVFQRWRAYR